MKRDDKLSRQLGRTQRRKRRNLDPMGVRTGDVGSAGADGCPNIGPPEAAREYRTDLGAGSVKGHQYTDVIISQTGLIPGVDVITYCFLAAVGDASNPTDLSCGGKLGLVKSGVLSQPNWGNGIAAEGWSLVKGSAYPVSKDGIIALEMTGSSTVQYIGSGSGSAFKYLQTAWQYEGTAAHTNTYVSLQEAHVGRLWVELQPGSRVFAGRSHSSITVGAAYGIQQQGNGIFAGVTYAVTGSATGTQAQGVGRSGAIWDSRGTDGSSYYMVGGSALTSDPLLAGTGFGGSPGVSMGNFTDNDTHILTEIRERSAEIGRIWYWNTILMDHKDVTFTGLPDGYYVRLTNGRFGSMQSVAASASGEVKVQPLNRSWMADGSGSRPEWTGEYPMHNVELWDGVPDGGGSTLILDCEIGRGIYGGDIWGYSATGFTGGTVTGVTSTIRLDFLNAAGGIIESYEPTGSSTTAKATITEAGIVVPTNAQRMRFTQWKRGIPGGYGIVDNLQVNNGSVCCPFTNPSYTSVPPSGAYVPPVTEVDPEDPDSGGTADANVQLAIDEHRQGGGNLVQESRDEQTIAAQTGDVDGTAYTRVTLADYGLEPGDVISVRGQAKIT